MIQSFGKEPAQSANPPGSILGQKHARALSLRLARFLPRPIQMSKTGMARTSLLSVAIKNIATGEESAQALWKWEGAALSFARPFWSISARWLPLLTDRIAPN